MSRGYYRNSLKAWRDGLHKTRRGLMSRYAIMERQHHQDTLDQGILLDINRQLIETVETALRVADALENISHGELIADPKEKQA